jgi:cytochrome c553
MSKRMTGVSLVALGGLVFAATAMAADAKVGRDFAKQKCQTCHGIDGIAKIPVAPHLAGENEIYIQTQLKAFRTGKRVHEMMSVIAKELTDEQISDVAAWYASIKIEAKMPE